REAENLPRPGRRGLVIGFFARWPAPGQRQPGHHPKDLEPERKGSRSRCCRFVFSRVGQLYFLAGQQADGSGLQGQQRSSVGRRNTGTPTPLARSNVCRGVLSSSTYTPHLQRRRIAEMVGYRSEERRVGKESR